MKQILKLKIYCIYNFFKEKKVVFFLEREIVSWYDQVLSYFFGACSDYIFKKKKKKNQ